jgi:ABC-type antimicrobial peptide transport system permease subunit
MLIALAVVPIVAGATNQLLSAATVSWTDWVWALSLTAGISLLIAVFPIFQALRQDIASGLKENVA